MDGSEPTPLQDKIKITFEDQRSIELPVVHGSEDERGIDISRLRGGTKVITLDPGLGNTGSCESKITFIDGEEGILRYRGYPIEQLAEHSSHLEAAYLLINGELLTAEQLKAFETSIANVSSVPKNIQQIFSIYPHDVHPMGILMSILPVLCKPEYANNDRAEELRKFDEISLLLIAQMPTIIAMIYRKKKSLGFIESDPSLAYTKNFLNMLFKETSNAKAITNEAAKALDLILLLHADHEQNCSTSTVRAVGSSGTNLWASIVAGIAALWGPLHGGANMDVIKMLEDIHATGEGVDRYIAQAEDKSSSKRLTGFGHRVYKTYDPRAKILKVACDTVLEKLGGEKDPLLRIAKELEEKAINEDYFKKRNLYPNVDFYSGLILKALGIPEDMFTTIFVLGRTPGWIAQWLEGTQDPKTRILRPRQIYTGPTVRDYPKNKE